MPEKTLQALDVPDLDTPGLLVMDVDSTLIDEEVIDELGQVAGAGDAISEVTAQAMNGSIDFETSLRQRVQLLAGLDASAFDEVFARLHLTTGAQRLIDTLHAHGWKVGVVSGGFHQIVDRLARQTSLDHWMANELEVTNNTLTGRLVGPVVDKTSKLQALHDWSRLDAVPMSQTVAVGDGSNDIPMLGSAALGIAFCAKPAVRRAAHCSITTRDLGLVLELLGHC